MPTFIDGGFEVAKVEIRNQQADDGFTDIIAAGIEYQNSGHDGDLVRSRVSAFSGGCAIEIDQRCGGAYGDFADDDASVIRRILVHGHQIFVSDAFAVGAPGGAEQQQNGDLASGRFARVGFEILRVNQAAGRAGSAGQHQSPC